MYCLSGTGILHFKTHIFCERNIVILKSFSGNKNTEIVPQKIQAFIRARYECDVGNPMSLQQMENRKYCETLSEAKCYVLFEYYMVLLIFKNSDRNRKK